MTNNFPPKILLIIIKDIKDDIKEIEESLNNRCNNITVADYC